jgi:opacity protein-like surface antigen
MRSGLLLFAVLGASVLAVESLAAQQIRSPYRYIDEAHTVGGYVGYLSTGSVDPDVGPQNAPMLGLRYNYRLTGPLSAEANIGYSPSERDIYSYVATADAVLPTGETAPMNIVTVSAGLLFHLTGQRTWNRIAPFAGVNVGIASNLSGRTAFEAEVPENQQYNFGTAFAVELGAGTDVFLAERISLRIQARDHLLRLRVPAGLIGAQRAETQWTHNIGLSLGTAFHF